MRQTNEWSTLLAAGALAVAVVVAGTVLARTWTAAPPSPRAELTTPSGGPAGGEGVEALPSAPVTHGAEADAADRSRSGSSSEIGGDEALRIAAERAPFDPARRPTAERYRLPGEAVTSEPAPAPVAVPPPAPPFRLLGTIAGAAGGVAVLQVEGSSAHVLSLGEELFGYRIARIGPGEVTMAAGGRDLTLSVAGPMPGGAQVAAEREGRGGADADARREREQVERATALQERFVQQLGQLRALQDRGMGEIELQTDRLIFTGPGGVRRELPLPPGASVVRHGDGTQMLIRRPPGGAPPPGH